MYIKQIDVDQLDKSVIATIVEDNTKVYFKMLRYLNFQNIYWDCGHGRGRSIKIACNGPKFADIIKSLTSLALKAGR